MTIEQAIEKAFAGGYGKDVLAGIQFYVDEEGIWYESEQLYSIYEMLLDPAFWRALFPKEGDAKIMAWGLVDYLFHEQANTIEGYFKQIPSVGSQQSTEASSELPDMRQGGQQAYE